MRPARPRLDAVRTLVPQHRLLAFLVGGAALISLAVATPAILALAAAYHVVLLWALIRDARRLPPPASFSAVRSLPDPCSLGARHTVGVEVWCPRATGLQGAIADHVPAALAPSPREVHGEFDHRGLLAVEYTVRPPRRGAYELPCLDLRVWSPGSWWLRQVRVPLRDSVAVYPNVTAIRRWELAQRRGVRPRSGLRRARPPGAATAPASLREYVPGDDVRHISWKATARRDAPVTNQMEAERGQQTVIALDCGRLMTAPAGDLTKHDQAVNAALLLAWVAQSQGDRVGLLTFADRLGAFLPPRRGAQQVSRLREALYGVRSEYLEPSYAEAFASLARLVHGRSLVVTLTDVLDPEASADLVAHALRLGARHRVLIVAMQDPELVAALRRPISTPERAYEWAAGEELASARRRAFETLRRGGVECLDVEAGRLSPALVERYLELKERGMV